MLYFVYSISTHKVNRLRIRPSGEAPVRTVTHLHTEKLMNEKFFDLKKEKQDRMVNAALKVFAIHGYGHASTDDIVKEAGISKEIGRAHV